MQDVATLKRSVAQALRILGFAVNAGLSPTAAGNVISHTLEQLAEALQRARDVVPADVTLDAGLTAAVVSALTKAAREAMESHTTAATSRAQAHTAGWDEDVAVGHLVRETRLLVAAARASRKSDGAVPQVRSRLLTRTKKKAAAKKAETPVVAAAVTQPSAAVGEPAPR